MRAAKGLLKSPGLTLPQRPLLRRLHTLLMTSVGGDCPGRHDLAYAMLRAGGGRRLAEQLGLEFEERRGRKRKHAREKASRLPPRPEGSALDDFVLV